MNISKSFVAMAVLAFVIAKGAMAGGTASAAIVPTGAPVASTAPSAAPPAAVAVAGTQNLSSTSTDGPLDPITMLGVALTGVGILLLRRPIRHL
jgi:hypothetical protein